MTNVMNELFCPQCWAWILGHHRRAVQRDGSGSAICWSICEALMITGSWVMIATHTPLITKLQDLNFNVSKSVWRDDQIEMTCSSYPIQFGKWFLTEILFYFLFFIDENWRISYHMEVLEEQREDGRSKLNYTHIIRPGVTQLENYGRFPLNYNNPLFSLSLSILAHFFLFVCTRTFSRPVQSLLLSRHVLIL